MDERMLIGCVAAILIVMILAIVMKDDRGDD